MALNSLAAIAAAHALGHPLDAVLHQLATFAPVVGRGRQFDALIDGKRVTVIDEAYNANPGSMQAALRLLGSKKGVARRIAVLGEMAELGADAKSFHTALAPLIAANRIDRVHVSGELYEDFWRKVPSTCRGSRSQSLKEMLDQIKADLEPGDCLLLKGSHSAGLHRIVEDLAGSSQA